MSFTIQKVVKITGIKRDTLKAWVHHGFVEPSIEKVRGSGKQNVYSLDDLYLLMLFDKLVAGGYHRRQASRIIKSIKMVKADYSTTKFLAFIKRPIAGNPQLMIRKSGPYFTKDGKLISEKAIAPEIRVIGYQDMKNSFETLFITFDDVSLPKIYDLKNIEIDSITIINFARIKNWVDSAIEQAV